MNVLTQILQVGNLITAFIAPSVEFALKLKHLLELDPDFQVNVTQLTGEAIKADETTLKIIADWKAKHGLS